MPWTLSSEEYDRGDRIRLTATIRDLENDNVLVDPDTLEFTILEPDASTTTYVYGTDAEVIRDSVGVFHVYWDAAQSGLHWARYAASGNVGAAEELGFKVGRSKVLP